MPERLRVAFAGTPEFAAVALRAVLARGLDVPLVLSQPDRPAGRGMRLLPSAVKQVALQHGLALAQPRSLRLDGRWPDDAAAARDALCAAAPDVLVVAAYGLLLPGWVLELPRLGCVNIHASLLPRWRGAAPIQRAIAAGDAQSGVSIMRMDVGLDTGPVYRMQELDLDADETAATLHDRLAALGAEMLLQVLDDLAAGVAEPTAQPNEGICYAAKIDKRETWLDWNEPAVQLERRVRALLPQPAAHARTAALQFKVHGARVGRAAGAAGPAGTVLALGADGVEVACGDGSLWLTRLQRPGGRPLASAELLRSTPLEAGERFVSGAPD
jgi:methionyl-tRNA formyltransferase